jgi:hypothetical protein
LLWLGLLLLLRLWLLMLLLLRRNYGLGQCWRRCLWQRMSRSLCGW